MSTNREKSGLKRQIFRAFECKYSYGAYVQLPVYEERIQYDRAGRILRHKELHWRLNPRKKPLDGKYVHTYDGAQEMEVDYYFPGKHLMRREKKMYDQNERLSCVRAFSSDGKCLYENHYTYEDRCDVVEMIDFNIECDLTSIYKYAYDKYGNMVQQSVYDSKGSLLRETNYSYDNKGYKIKESTTGGFGVLQEMIFYVYSGTGELVQKKFFDQTLEEMTSYSRRHGKGWDEVISRNCRFECDCSGVRQIPDSLEVTKNVYF